MKENQDVTIPCEVSGFPEPTVHWYFNGLSMMEKLIGKLYSCSKCFNDVTSTTILQLRKQNTRNWRTVYLFVTPIAPIRENILARPFRSRK